MTGDVDALVVGAGVIGLTTAIRLLDAGGRVAVVTADDPGDTTSVLATAMVGPTFGFSGPRAAAWEVATTDVFRTEGDALGVRLRRGRFVAVPSGFVPPSAEHLPGFSPCSDEETPVGFGTAFWLEVPLVDMPAYLAHLVDRFTAAGGELRRQQVSSLAEAATLAPLVANCAGLGARTLVPDADVTPVRGPKIVVTNPGIDTFLISGPPGPQTTSFHPVGDVVVLGGSATTSDGHDAGPRGGGGDHRTLRGHRTVPWDTTVLEHRVGLRPGRPEVRLELEHVGTTAVVHDYGHAGVGVTLSWGCAEETARLLLGDRG